jgi:hypothetical protein
LAKCNFKNACDSYSVSSYFGTLACPTTYGINTIFYHAVQVPVAGIGNLFVISIMLLSYICIDKMSFQTLPVIALLALLALAPWSVQHHVAKRSKKNVDIVTIVIIMSLKLLFYLLSVILKMPAIATVAVTLVPWPVLQEMESILYFIMLSKYLWHV